MEGRIAAKLEPDTPATFGDSAGVALKDDEDAGWESTLPAVGQHYIVDEVMSDVMDEHTQGAEGGHPGQAEADAPGQAASQPSLLPSAHLRSLAGADASSGISKPGLPAKSSLSADASSAAVPGCVTLRQDSAASQEMQSTYSKLFPSSKEQVDKRQCVYSSSLGMRAFTFLSWQQVGETADHQAAQKWICVHHAVLTALTLWGPAHCKSFYLLQQAAQWLEPQDQGRKRGGHSCGQLHQAWGEALSPCSRLVSEPRPEPSSLCRLRSGIDITVIGNSFKVQGSGGSQLPTCRFPELARVEAVAAGNRAEGASMGAPGRAASLLLAASRPAVPPLEAAVGLKMSSKVTMI